MSTAPYEVVTLSEDERGRLLRSYQDLMSLSECQVPSVRAAARSALALIAQAVNGQGLAYDLYSERWTD